MNIYLGLWIIIGSLSYLVIYRYEDRKVSLMEFLLIYFTCILIAPIALIGALMCASDDITDFINKPLRWSYEKNQEKE